ncbi:MAG: hypothetical protein QM608_09390 [Caulobacter sp.]
MTGEAGAAFAQFGAFARVFEEGRYLDLLHLDAPAPAIDLIRSIVGADPSAREGEVVALLRPDSFWRAQLVGVAAVLSGVSGPATLAAVWRALEHPSWVSPQLAATLSLVDPAFIAGAQRRLDSLCHVDAEPVRQRFRQSVEHCPDFKDGKQMAALLALLETIHGQTWVRAYGERPEVEQLLAKAREGDGLALGWRERAAATLLA